MTITSTPSEVSYAGDGVTVAFPIPFVFDTSADLKVTSTDADGNISVLTTGFVVSGGGGSTGTLTFGIAPASTVDIGILDNPEIKQSTDYVSNDPFAAESHERALDRGVRISKRLYQLIQRCVRSSDGDPAQGSDQVFPTVAARRGTFAYWADDDVAALEPAIGLPIGTPLSQSIIGALIYPQSLTESGAGISPADTRYQYGVFARYAPAISYANLRTAAFVDGVINMGRDSIFNGVNVGTGRNTGNARGTAIGNGALQSTGAGEDNTAVGYTAMATCSGLRNTAIGSRTMFNSSSAYQNTAVGNEALWTQTLGSRNVAVGESALFSLVDFAENTAVGAAALFTCNSHKNTAVGREAGYYISTGEHNVAIGYDALINMTTGSNNTAVGTFACQGGVVNGATGAGNAALGWGAMAQMTTATNNVAVGLNALTSITTGGSNTAVGKDAMLSLTTGQTNVAVGRIALDACTSGEENVAVGDNSLPSLTTGTGNTGIGKNANGTTTGTNNTALGKDSLTALSTETNCTGLGYQTAVTGSNQVQLGNSSTTTYAYGAVQNRSDARDKADIRDTVLGLDFIRHLRPVDFRWDYREDYGSDMKDGARKRSRFHHGLIAQEVKQTLDSLGIDFGGYQDHRVAGGKDVRSLGYGEFIGPLIRAIQELDARVMALEAA